jgi:acyl-CoA synthetase (AMP-forming)/AMP-acid ligase II/thioesterase domain-containing protein
MHDLTCEIRRLVPEQSRCPAIMAPGREALGYEALWRQTGEIAGLLSLRGLRRGDAVAIVMPDGPEQLATFLAVSQVAVCAPLNPAFRATEFESHLADLRARAVIVQAGLDSAAVLVARGMGIEVMEALPDRRGPAGALALRSTAAPRPEGEPVYPVETALLLHTSATTGRPKLVPLTHAQVISQVGVSREAYPKVDDSRALILVPQFHLHGILSFLIQLFSGGASICTSGFRPESFFDWMRTFAPTQYAANPTLQRAILSLCPPGKPPAAFHSLRFVTSTGAPMAPGLHAELERALGVPVVDGYGLTEAGRVTVTPLDPARRKPGSVGECVGPKIAILGSDGAFLGPGQEGEIVLRGPMVTSGYAHDPEANRRAFLDGWFRTGDLGYRDEDGFLFVVGRLKEMINRGAEKILPYEIEQVLSRHPGVREAAVFGYPHSRLGEDVGAAVVPWPEHAPTAPGLRRFAAADLAEFKIPRRIVFVSEIPKTRTGKPQRARMAELLNIAPARPGEDAADLDPLEARLAAIWSGLLAVSPIARDDDFFLLGGDSLLAVQMLAEVGAACSCNVGPEALMESASLEALAVAVRAAQASRESGRAESGLRTLQPEGAGRPLFLMCPDGGFFLYRDLIRRLGRERLVFGFEAAPNVPASMEALARRCAADLRATGVPGPYLIGGYSLGGILALETARCLLAAGEPIAGLILLDSDCFGWTLERRLRYYWRTFRECPKGRRLGYLRELWAGGLRARAHRLVEGRGAGQPGSSLRSAFATYRPEPLAVRSLFLRCLDSEPERRDLLQRHWHRILGGELLMRDVPGDHSSMMNDPHAAAVAEEMRRFMAPRAAEPRAVEPRAAGRGLARAATR